MAPLSFSRDAMHNTPAIQKDGIPFLMTGITHFRQYDYAGNKIWKSNLMGLDIGITFAHHGKTYPFYTQIVLGYWGSNAWRMGNFKLAHRERAFFKIPVDATVYFKHQMGFSQNLELGLGLHARMEYRNVAQALAPAIEKHRNEIHGLVGFNYAAGIFLPNLRLHTIIRHAVLPLVLGWSWMYYSNDPYDKTIHQILGLASILKVATQWLFHTRFFLQAEYQFILEAMVRRGANWYDLNGDLEFWHSWLISLHYKL